MKNEFSKVTAYISKDQRSKWEINSEKFFMIDFSDKNKTYRLFNPIVKKYYIRGDIIFNEKSRYESIKMIKFIDNETNKTN